MNSFLRSILLLLLVLFFLPSVWAGSLRGKVTDPQGVPVAGVLVEATSPGGRVWKAWTNESGVFQISSLPPANYKLAALSGDFEPAAAEVSVTEQGSATRDLQFPAIRRSQVWIEVVGEPTETLKEIPGSVHLVTREELVRSHAYDANEIFRRIPGVTLREDSGPVAMRLNIAMRGLNPDRSRQVLMLEDGLPIALAPYGEPEMYYSPPIDRMRRVEVLKGSGQIVHGPQTIGGVINFITPEPPPSFHGEVDLTGGQRGVFTGNAMLGSSTRDQKFGWLVTALHKRGDGFRDFFYDIDDIHVKTTWRPAQAHQFSAKFGWYDENSNSTYLGITTPMFEQDPGQNAVPGDFLKVRRFTGSVLHTATLSPRAVLSSSFFSYDTVRNWRRQDFDRADLGRAYLGVAGDPSIPGGAIYLRDSAGNRNRAFRVWGAQSNLSLEHNLWGRRNKLDSGARYVREKHDDAFIAGSTTTNSTGLLRDDEDRFGNAFSFYAQNRIFLTDKLVFTPGIRFEHYEYTRHITTRRVGGVPQPVDIRGGDGVNEIIPGFGLSYQTRSWLTLFAGVHRGFAPPRVKDAINASGESLLLDAELSWNYEAGVRIGPHRGVQGEVTWFRLDFQNQIIPAAQSGGATTTLVNAGETLNQGLESSLRVNWHEFTGGRLLITTDVRHMFLGAARFTRNALFLNNRLPYAPRHTFSVLVDVRQRQGFGVQLDGSYIGGQFGDNNMTVVPSADSTIGMLPSYMVWNLSVDYTFRRERYTVRPYVGVKNLANRAYIASRAPEGIQPGLFRQVNAGVRVSF